MGYYGGNPESVYFYGIEQPAIMLIKLHEEEFFDAYDASFTCDWYGEMHSFSDHSLNYTDAILWDGWEYSVTELGNDCEDLNPDVWGDSTPGWHMESNTWALGLAEMSSALAADLEAAVGSTEWASEYEPCLLSGILGFDDPHKGDFVGYEGNYSWSCEIDETGELTHDSSGSAVTLDLDGSGVPHGYIYQRPVYYWYSEGALY